MTTARKLFTIDEANGLVPFLQESIDALQRLIREIVLTKKHLEVLNLICQSNLNSQNLDLQEHRKKTSGYHRLVGQADALISEVRMRGCLLRDVQTGMVDFYAELDGRIVFLCWRRGESTIDYWHPVGEGYGKRRLIAGKSA